MKFVNIIPFLLQCNNVVLFLLEKVSIRERKSKSIEFGRRSIIGCSCFISLGIDFFLSLLTGVISGCLVSMHFKRKEEKEKSAKVKKDLLTEWVTYIVSLNEEINFELNDKLEHLRSINRILDRKMDLCIRSAAFFNKEALYNIQENLVDIECIINSDDIDSEAIDNLLKEIIQSLGEAYSNNQEK